MSGVEAGASSSTSSRRRERTARPRATSLMVTTQARQGLFESEANALGWPRSQGVIWVYATFHHLGL